MKKMFLRSVFISATVLLFACGDRDEVKVRDTCENFLSALLEGDLTTAKTMVTPETHEKWGDAANLLDESFPPEVRANLKAVKTRVSNVVVHGDEAQATLAVGIPSELVGQVTTLHLQKHGNIWLIHEPGILVKEVLKKETIILDVQQ